MTELDQLTALFEQMGADANQARTMASQLLKRAEQISRERGVDHVAALAELLKLVRSGRAGETYPGHRSDSEADEQ